MPPKKSSGEDTRGAKAKEAKARSAADKKAKDDSARAAAEDEEWRDGANLKAQKRKEEAEAKRVEAEARKAVAAAQLAEEEAALGKGGKGLRGAERIAARKALSMDAFAAALESASTTETFEARSVDAAIAVLGANSDAPAAERHPERRMKSAYAAFEEREMSIMKEENPGLRLSQLKNLLQKKWKKSPDNPMNQEHIEYNEKL